MSNPCSLHFLPVSARSRFRILISFFLGFGDRSSFFVPDLASARIYCRLDLFLALRYRAHTMHLLRLMIRDTLPEYIITLSERL